MATTKPKPPTPATPADTQAADTRDPMACFLLQFEGDACFRKAMADVRAMLPPGGTLPKEVALAAHGHFLDQYRTVLYTFERDHGLQGPTGQEVEQFRAEARCCARQCIGRTLAVYYGGADLLRDVKRLFNSSHDAAVWDVWEAVKRFEARPTGLLGPGEPNARGGSAETEHYEREGVIRCGYCGAFTRRAENWRDTVCGKCGRNIATGEQTEPPIEDE